MELIERDAFWIVMRNKLCMPDVEISRGAGERILGLINKLNEVNIKPYIKDFSTDIKIPSFHVLLEDTNHEEPVFTRGSGTHLDPRVALERALAEACQLRITQVSLLQMAPSKQKKLVAEDNHLLGYLKWSKYKNRELVSHLYEKGPKKISFEEITSLSSRNLKVDIEYLIGTLKKGGMEVIIVDITRKEIGFPVVRASIPGLQPPDYYFNNFSPRLSKVPPILGHESKRIEPKNAYQGEILH